MVHLFHSLFFFLVGLYYMARRLFACQGELTNYVILSVVELTAEAFAMRRSMRAVTWADQSSHMEGVAPHVWQSMHFERAGKLSDGGRNFCVPVVELIPLVLRCLAYRDIGSKSEHHGGDPGSFFLLTSWAPIFKEELGWLFFSNGGLRAACVHGPH